MTPSEAFRSMKEDDIYLVDMWRLLAREWRWFAATLVIVLLATFAFVHGARPRWSASAWIQVGEIGTTPSGHDPKIEPFQRVIDRIKTPLFQDQVLRGAGIPLKGREAGLYRKSLRLDPDPYANLIELSVRAPSPAEAQSLALATVAQLQSIHRGIASAPLAQARARLRRIEGQLRDAEAARDRARPSPSADGRSVPDGAGTPTRLLAAMLASDRDAAIRSLATERDDLALRLGPHYTYDTSAPWPAYVPDAPAFPNPLLCWGLGGLSGTALAILVAVSRNAVRRRRESLA